MEDKITLFLEKAGFQVNPGEPLGIQLIRYFESEYDVSLLNLLEKEWLEEQAGNDYNDEFFNLIRSHLDEQDIPAYDKKMKILAAP